MPSNHKNPRIRQKIAQATARILVADPTLNPERVRCKVAAQIGVTNQRQWPNRAEVFAALALEQRLFRPEQPHFLHKLRKQALNAMRHFAKFQPHLVGSVWDGTADYKSCIQLYLFAETPDDVLLVLLEDNIPWNQYEKFLHYSNGNRQPHPVFSFNADDMDIELIVLPLEAYRNPPLDAMHEHPERGANMEQVEKIL